MFDTITLNIFGGPLDGGEVTLARGESRFFHDDEAGNRYQYDLSIESLQTERDYFPVTQCLRLNRKATKCAS